MPKALIIGAGPSGLALALSLSAINIPSTIFELRPQPSTIGGSINLTPSALRCLSSLGVELDGLGCRVNSIEIFSLHTGKLLGELPFLEKLGCGALRILREELLGAMLRAVERDGRVSVKYGCKLVRVEEDEGKGKVFATFENGEVVEGDFVLGCDGVHSFVRTRYVDPGRLPLYTNVAVAYSVVDGEGIATHFRDTAMNSGRFGSFLMSYIDPDRKKVYLGAVMEMREQNDKQGWRSRGKDSRKTMVEIDRRYRNTAIACIDRLLDRVDDFVFYPVYTLGPGGRWSRGRVLLLGDAAHGMPPQGESTGFAIEDGILLSKVFESCPKLSIKDAFKAYEKIRRPRIDAAYKEAVSRWESVKDKSWLMQKFIEWLMWIILWYKMRNFGDSMSYDVRQEDILASTKCL